MHKKIILLLLTLNNFYTSPKDISLYIKLQYQKNRFKKALNLDGKYLMGCYKKKLSELSKQINNYLRSMKSRENNIKRRQKENSIKKALAVHMKCIQN